MLYGDHEHLDEDGNPIDVEDAEGFQFGEDSDDGERSEDESVLSGDWLVRDDEPANEDERTDEEGGELISVSLSLLAFRSCIQQKSKTISPEAQC